MKQKILAALTIALLTACVSSSANAGVCLMFDDAVTCAAVCSPTLLEGPEVYLLCL